MNWETLLSLGDSITFGARSYAGYPEICGHVLSEKLNKEWNVVNHATNGFTTIDLLRSVDKNWANLKILYPSIITVLIGTNDIKQNTAAEDFVMAYELLVTKARLLAINNNILLLKIPHFTKDVFYPYNYGMNKKVEEFNICIDSIAKKFGLRTLALNLSPECFYDGVHFSALGSKESGLQIADLILRDKGHESITGMS
jgi:lysophospholipase L1-like esterase